jgi:hypothetical protein
MARPSRPLALFLLLCASACGPFALGCADDQVATGDDSVTEVPHSSVKDQSTDNCWLYATMGWTESLHLSATGEELNLSESYLTYWHWFEQIVAGEVVGGKVEEGGSWGLAADLILKYGVLSEGDFIPPEENEILSKRQAEAVKIVNAELTGGALRSGGARRNRVLVRDVLDRAWRLTSRTKSILDRTFGEGATRTLEGGNASIAADIPIVAPAALAVKLRNPETGRLETKTLADALGTHRSAGNLEQRKGALAWQDVPYPRSAASRRSFWARVRHALNDKQPVIINWTIDDNAFTPDGKYPDVPAKPGPQGGHMVLGFDYAVDNVPGFGSLEAGVLASPAALAATLDERAEMRFLRVKNSWSPTFHALPSPAPAGYHDLFVKYLSGPMAM